MALDIKVTIDLTEPAGTFGFGIPLILQEKATTAKAYTVCTKLEDVVTAGYAKNTEVYNAAKLIFMQTDKSSEIAIEAITDDVLDYLGSAENTKKGWRQLLVVSPSEDGTSVSDIVSAVENCEGKMFFASLPVDDTTTINTTDMTRSVLFYCTDVNYNNPVAALVGEISGLEPGSYTVKNLMLKGIQPQNLSDQEITAIHNKGGITYVTKAGDNVVSEGIVAGGEYIDIIDAVDYVIEQIEYNLQKVLNQHKKIAYDDTGIALLSGSLTTTLQNAFLNGIIANNNGVGSYNVTTKSRAETTEAERKSRQYNYLDFDFELAGAIHGVSVNGTVSY